MLFGNWIIPTETCDCGVIVRNVLFGNWRISTETCDCEVFVKKVIPTVDFWVAFDSFRTTQSPILHSQRMRLDFENDTVTWGSAKCITQRYQAFPVAELSGY